MKLEASEKTSKTGESKDAAPLHLPLVLDKTIDVCIGVVTGIFTTAFLFFIAYVFNNQVIPWYQSVVYEGIIISGTWHAELDPQLIVSPDRRVVNEMKIDQHGHKVTGLVTKRTEDKATGKWTSESFILEGRIRDRLFYGYIYPKSQDRLSALSFLYQVEGSGARLEGQRVFYHIVDSQIKSGKEVWEKQR